MTQITDKERQQLIYLARRIAKDIHMLKFIFDMTTDCETPNGRELETRINECARHSNYIEEKIPLI